MSLRIPEGIPDSTNLMDGLYDFKVESMEPTETSTGKLAIKVALRVTKGLPNTKGLMHFEQFTIGSNDDPQAREESTWIQSFGAIQVKKMCTKAGVKFTGRALEEVAAEIEGQKVSGRVVYTVQPKFNKDGTENQYAGNARSQVKDWFEVGERTPGADAAPTKAGAVAAVKKAPKAPPPPEDDDDDDDAPPPPKKVKKAAKPESEEEEEEEEAPKAKSKSKPKPVEPDDEDDD